MNGLGAVAVALFSVTPELNSPPVGFGLIDRPPIADLASCQIAAMDLAFDGVAAHSCFCRNLGGGQHTVSVRACAIESK